MKSFSFIFNFALFLLIFDLSVAAQNYDPSKVKKKAVQLYNQALEKASDGNLAIAANLFLRCIEADNNYVDAYLSLAGVYGEEKITRAALSIMKKHLHSTQTIPSNSNYPIPSTWQDWEDSRMH